MDFLAKQIAPPRNWDFFEELTRALFAAIYANPLAKKNGRRGQPQHGVDVYVERAEEPGSWIGIQCKGKEQNYGAKATAREFDAELAKAERFQPGLSLWIFVTTAPDDAELQEHARKVSTARSAKGLFAVDILGWDALVALIAEHQPVMREFYSEHISPLPDQAARLAQVSADALTSIDDTLRHGTTQFSLLRLESVVPAARALSSERVVRLTGEGGSGKSGILKRLAQRFDGASLVLKDNRVSATTLAEYLLHQLELAVEASALLDEIAGDGPALLVIDGADRLLMSERRAVVIDLLRALARSATRARWQILTSARRYQDRDLVADALSEAEFGEMGVSIAIEGMTKEDSKALELAFPGFARLLQREDIGAQIRSLFLLRELLTRKAPLEGAWSELDIADAWATGEFTEPSRAAHRSRALAQFGSALAAAPWRLPGRAELDPEGLQILLDEGAVLQLPNRDALRLVHDVHEDWLLARQLHTRAEDLPAVLIQADEPLWWLRGVRLSSQIFLEQGDFDGWRALLARIDASERLDPAWARAVLSAPLYSERASDVLVGLAPILLADDARLLKRIIDTLLIAETRLDERVLAFLADRDEATRYAMAAYWKQPEYGSWVPFLRWSLPLWTSWPVEFIPRLSEIAAIFARALVHVPNRISEKLAVIVLGWLVEIEDTRRDSRWDDRREPFGLELDGDHAWETIEERLREVLVATAGSSPRTMQRYLDRVTVDEGMREARGRLIESPGRIPAQLPREWAEMCARQFVPRRRRARRDGLLGGELFSFHEYQRAGLRGESRLSPASPLRAGFDQLFEADPDAALRLFHRLERRASTFWRWFVKCHDRRRPRPLTIDLGARRVILWGDDPVYRWSRGILGSEVLGSAYLALDDWLEREVAGGRPVGELIDLVLRNHGLVASVAPLIAILGENINQPGVIDHAGPFLAVPRLWEFDVRRHMDDLGTAHRIGCFSPHNVHFQARESNHQRHKKRTPLHHALLLPFRLMSSPEPRIAFDAARAAWTHADLADFTDELESEALIAERTAQIERYTSDGDPERIVFEEAEQGIKVSIAPPKKDAADVAALDAANRLVSEAMALANWVRATREQDQLAPEFSLDAAMARAAALSTALNAPDNPHLDFARRIGGAAIVGTAAIAVRYLNPADIEVQRSWIENWLYFAARAGEREEYDDAALLFDDFQVLAAWGIAALASRTPDNPDLDALAAALATHRLDGIAQATLEGLNWQMRPDFVRALHIAALDTCVADYGWWWRGERHKVHAERRRAQSRARAASRALKRPQVRAPLAPPQPDDWRLIWTGKWPFPLRLCRIPAKRQLSCHRALKLVEVIDWHALTEGDRYAPLFGDYLRKLLAWTRAYSEESDRHDRQFPYEWGHGLAKALGRFAMALGEDGHWQALRTFEYHNRAEELVGDYLDGVVTTLVVRGEAPNAAFWAAWQPAATWLIEHAVPKCRDSYDQLSQGVRAAGLVGPYMTPLPHGWPHLELVLEAVGRWVSATAHLPAGAYATLEIVERMNSDQRARWFLPWLTLWTEQHGSSESFWSYNGLGNKAAALLKPLSDGSDAVRAQGRKNLAILADAGSTAARELIAAFASSRRS